MILAGWDRSGPVTSGPFGSIRCGNELRKGCAA